MKQRLHPDPLHHMKAKLTQRIPEAKYTPILVMTL